MTDEHGKAVILVVDDTPDVLHLATQLLKPRFRIKTATTGEKGLEIAAREPVPDLILLDIMMPGIDGYDTCLQLKAQDATRDIPVIFFSAQTGQIDEVRCFEVGAVDFIPKPISPDILQARVNAQLALKTVTDLLRDQNAHLEHEVARRTAEMVAIQDVTITAMASLAETRDSETGNHILRTQSYVKALAESLRQHPRFAAMLTDHYIDLLFKSAPLHDIGKIGIPDFILLKPGKLTVEEFEVMKTHTTLGHDALANAERLLGRPVEFFLLAKEVALSHQEKWDGSGYPQALVGDAIPLSARLMAVADVYDALISRRVYKAPMSHQAATEIIVAGAGQHFDPDIVAAFITLQDEFRAIAARYADHESDIEQKVASLARFKQT
ncbi:HD-GYP domain-containing protein [Silvimonas iriomotensis]|uniref:Two-component system response regulator n=1 Tax=Silvimonas iriomotensis TaxID=449662 RepID=A0ABQ2PB97_9NEIS|nr:two-component system response regulator [Silvimonas iriomotensis]GGP22622.1 two-component system response regulator [Silvimonas iriomotensis]